MKVEREDFERSFERFEMPEPAFERLVERRERRLRRERIEAGIAALVIVATTAAILARAFVATPVPADHAPAWTTADLNGVIVTNPGAWHLVGYSDGNPGDIALTTFAPDLSSTDPCAGMPSDGVILRIHSVAGSTAQTWPVELTPEPGASDRGCNGEHLQAAWSVGGRTLEAAATLGPDVAERNRADLLRVFSSLTFAAPERAVIFKDRCPDFTTIGAEVLAAETSGPRPWTMLATSSCVPAESGGIVVATIDELSFGSAISQTDLGRELDVHDRKQGARSGVAGVVGPEVARVELETTDGQSLDALLVGRGFSATGNQIYLAPLENLATGIITTYDAVGRVLQTARFSPGMDCEYNPSECMRQIRPGQTIAASYANGDVAWELREQGTTVELLDANNSVIGSVAVGDRLVATAVPLQASKLHVVFGIAPSGTAIVMRQIASVGWGIMPTAQLQDGTVVFWAEAQAGDTLAVAAFDTSCHAIDAVDPEARAATDAPTERDCLEDDGG
jgi:hypothetical protein